MAMPVLATKLYIAPTRRKVVLRLRLIERLNEALHRKLTLISAPAGFGKTTLVSEWLANLQQAEGKHSIAWLSLDEGDSDPTRFLTYVIAALQTIAPRQPADSKVGESLLMALQSPQPPPTEWILTSLVNEVTAELPDNFVLVLDDYHAIDSQPVDRALAFLVDHLPTQMHLVIATREDPALPLGRLRAQSQLVELRAADLRFTPSEAAEFLNQVMGLKLSAENIAALEARTEGWIAGLQLAALAVQGLSNQGHSDTASFIKSFTGSHHFVMDYLVEEVLHQQPENVQAFLLRTSILDRLCGPLCDAVCLEGAGPLKCSSPGQEILEYLEHANLFIVPLDNERRWYRYHHLFADLLRQRLRQQLSTSIEDAKRCENELHIRASQWYEDNGLPLEAFRHAAAANDVDRAERLIEGKGIPLHFVSPVSIILDWLGTLPKAVMDSKPSLWWRFAALLLIAGQTAGVEEKLQSAEAALQAAGQDETSPDGETRNLIGQIAAARATLALTRYDIQAMLAQSNRALEFLAPESRFTRASANWTRGYAYLLLGDRAAARQALMESIALSQKAGATFTLILATIGLGNVQEVDNQLHQAAETYRHVLHLAGDQPQQIIHEAHLGLARILYEWNDLDAAVPHVKQSLRLAQQYDERVIDRSVICEVFLARLSLARGDAAGAAAQLTQTAQTVRQRGFLHRLPEIAAVQIAVMLKLGNTTAAAQLAEAYKLPIPRARVRLEQGSTEEALALLDAFLHEVESKGWQDERLKGLVLQAVALDMHSETDRAIDVLKDAVALAEPGGFIRTFLEEGQPMQRLLSEVWERGEGPHYIAKLLAAFDEEKAEKVEESQPIVEPLSQRELEVLHLIAQGLSNQAISEQLFLALDTVKGHNRKIFEKLQVQRRTEAVARARELGLL